MKIYFESLVTELFNISLHWILLILYTSIGIYFAVILLTRISGKRSFSKMSSFDFAMTVAVGSIISSTILTDTINLATGSFGLLMIYILQFTAAYFRRFSWFSKLIDNQPTLIMDGSTILEDNMRAVKITENDLRSTLRAANVIQLSDVKAVIFETTGELVVIHKNNSEAIDNWLLKDVNR